MLIFRDNSFELQPSVAAIARQKKGGQPRGHDLNIWNSCGRWVCLAFDRLQKVISGQILATSLPIGHPKWWLVL